MKKFLFALGLVALPMIANAMTLEEKETGLALTALEIRETDEVLGSADAPVTIVEYASMTCGHCADFYNKKLPEIKEKFVNTGRAKLVLRDLPWDPVAQAVSAVARCAPKGQFHAYVSAFMSTHDTWMRSADVLSSIKQVARLGGMSGEDVDACLQNVEVLDSIAKSKKEALDVLMVKGTPTFFVNGHRVEGAMSAEGLEEALKKLEN